MYACISIVTCPPVLLYHSLSMCNHSDQYANKWQWHTLVVCCSSCRVQRKVVSLCVFKEGDWLRLGTWSNRYDSINTLVMYRVIAAIPILVDDHRLLVYLRYPVHSSQYYMQWLFHTSWKLCSIAIWLYNLKLYEILFFSFLLLSVKYLIYVFLDLKLFLS